MPRVELLYDDDCPNVDLARSNLRQAFGLAGLTPNWSEHRIGPAGAPARLRGYGSPTVLVDGADVAGVAAGDDQCCRVYDAGGQMSKAPATDLIADALRKSAIPQDRGGNLAEPT
jgi:mercuric ion transport protein